MKKITFLILCIFLVGCSERELKFDRVYPDTSNIDAIRAENQANQPNSDSAFFYLIDSNIKPERVDVGANTNIEAGYAAWPSVFCWAATYEECEHLKPNDSFNDDRYPIRYFTIEANSKISITYYNLSTVNNKLPTPDDIEIYIFNRDLTLTPYPYKKINDYTWEFTLPSDSKTTTMFMFKAIYKTKIGGVTYYPIPITGK